jgi:GntR family transcriptional regulator
MSLKLNPASGIPLYVQLVEQVKHAIETGAIQAGYQLPSVRKMAEDLLINPNTVAKAYQDLEREGVIELRHGSGAFVLDSIVAREKLMLKAGSVLRGALDRLDAMDLTEDEIRRLVENELAMRRRTPKLLRKKHA